MADICTNACYAIGNSLVRPFNCSVLNILNISTVIVILFYLIYPSICLKKSEDRQIPIDILDIL